MKRLLVLATIAIASSAFASIGIEFRGEHTSVTTDTAAGSTTAAGYFNPRRLRINMKQDFAEKFTLIGQIDLVKLEASAAGDGGLNRFYVQHKMSDTGTFSFGKLANVMLSGAERYYGGASTDGYFVSFNEKYSGYRPMGLTYDHMMGDHKVQVALLHNDWANGTTSTGTTNGMGYGLAWEGKFGKFVGTASYHSVPDESGSGTPAAGASDTYMSLGFDYRADAWTAAFSYLANTNAAGSTAGADLTSNSMVLNFAYKMGNWRFPIKFESTSGNGINTTNTTDDKQTQYLLAAEFCPNGADNYKKLRYHVAYMNMDRALDGGASTITKTMLVGFRMDTDIAK